MVVENKGRAYSEAEAAENIKNADRTAGKAMMDARVKFLQSPDGQALEAFALEARTRFAASSRAAGVEVRKGAIAGADAKIAAAAVQRGPRIPA